MPAKDFLFKYFLAFCFFWAALNSSAQGDCTPNDKAFDGYESLNYKIQYHWGFIWLTAGEVTFSVKESDWQGNSCYYFRGDGRTYDSYDWFYKVRDVYEAWSDVNSLKPYEYKRKVHEGGYEVENHYVFDYDKKLIYTDGWREQKVNLKDTLLFDFCMFDVLSLVYYTRCIDFDSFKEGDVIPMSIILDNELHNISIVYWGKDKLEYNDVDVPVIKFSSQMIAGSIFNEDDIMYVYVSDDQQRKPLKVRADILIGAIEANLFEE